MQAEQAKVRAKARREKVQGCSDNPCGQKEPQQNLIENDDSQGKEASDSKILLKACWNHATERILHFLKNATGHKRNVHFKEASNPDPENPAHFFSLS